MQSLLVVTLLATLFVVTHIAMSTTPIRSSLVRKIGESRFVTLYGVVASIQFAALLVYYAAHRFDGLPGLNLAAVPAIRWALITVIGIGMALIGGSLVGYADSPFSVRGHNFREPYGMERITRHGFFAGTFLLGGAHALLAAHLNGRCSSRRWRYSQWSVRATRTTSCCIAAARPISIFSQRRRCCHLPQSYRDVSASLGANSRGADY